MSGNVVVSIQGGKIFAKNTTKMPMVVTFKRPSLGALAHFVVESGKERELVEFFFGDIEGNEYIEKKPPKKVVPSRPARRSKTGS
jgi:hypothetical protein